MNTVRFLTDEEIAHLSRFELLTNYMRAKLEEVGMHNALKAEGNPELIPNSRRLTNVGTFRAYVVNYLRQHPKIHQEMTLIVRQLEPGPEGLAPAALCLFQRYELGQLRRASGRHLRSPLRDICRSSG